ncbi:hypothetical protein R1sor_020951 [Riccia sorocarpa]|uniref:Uncharacterized protein n=1 Tax=Riccia sorocarpa TaxID=122646 RepID=A0ABD3GJ03_9MARC
MKRFASIFGVWGTLRLVDLRDNLDCNGVGVLEDGEHLTYFSAPHDPFWGTDRTQIRKGNRRLLKKESNLEWRKDCNKISYPPVSETARVVEIEESQSNPQMLISCQGEGVHLALSPLPHFDEESAHLLPTSILLSSTERFGFPNVCGSENNVMDSHVSDSTRRDEIPHPHGSSSIVDTDVRSKPTSRVASPLTPTYNSENKSSKPNRQGVLPLPQTPVCEWDSCSTSASTDNTKLTDLTYPPGSSFNMIFDQLTQKFQTESRVQVQYGSPLGCGAQKPTEQYLDDTWNLTNHQNFTEPTAHLVADDCDDTEWDAFMMNMAGKLQHVQEKLDKVMSSAEPDVLVTAQTAMATLQEGLQQLLAWET